MRPVCELCGFPMPPGEEMFRYHGYSGPCPKLPTKKELDAAMTRADEASKQLIQEATPDRVVMNEPCTI